MNTGDEEVWIPVVVIVADGNASIESRSPQVRLIRYVSECAIAIVAKKAVAIFWVILFQSGQVRAIGEENVEAAIAVVVEDRNPTRHGFRNIPGEGFVVFQAKRKGCQLKVDWADAVLIFAGQASSERQ